MSSYGLHLALTCFHERYLLSISNTLIVQSSTVHCNEPERYAREISIYRIALEPDLGMCWNYYTTLIFERTN